MLTPQLTTKKKRQIIQKMAKINSELLNLGLDKYDIQKLFNQAQNDNPRN